MERRNWDRLRNKVDSPILEVRKLKRKVFMTRILLAGKV